MTHPAKFSEPVLDALGHELQLVLSDRPPAARPVKVLDPFAGVGRIHTLSIGGAITTTGVELEPEWAQEHPGTIVGDALLIVERFGVESFDVVATSPCYGNRMADHHDAKDPCRPCGGSGSVPDLLADTGRSRCPACGGKGGLSKRNTYKAALGRDPSAGSAATMQWGPEYRRFHRDFLAEAVAVLRPGDGRLIVNMKNHYRDKVEQLVVEWWLATMLANELRLLTAYPVAAQGNRQGENYEARVERELILVCEKP